MTGAPRLEVVRFAKTAHDREGFDCGVAVLNDYLRKRASRHQKQGVSRIYVLVDHATPAAILGFYTLSGSHISRADLTERAARRLPRHPIPTITLGRMAVQREQQGKGHGALLLFDAIQRCARVSQQVGVYALVVDAKDESAKAFYRKYGFAELPEHPMRLILPMETAIQLLDD